NNHIMIDLSHGNSSKDYHNQPIVAQHIADQISAGDQHIAAVMIESFLVEGSQKISDKMTYGQSVTDQCISWDETVNVLELLAQSVRNRRQVGK
ncbi:MAG: 3-deoxy-7-phosphoheptulonate synthase, partial [Akkermansia sp.]